MKSLNRIVKTSIYSVNDQIAYIGTDGDCKAPIGLVHDTKSNETKIITKVLSKPSIFRPFIPFLNPSFDVISSTFNSDIFRSYSAILVTVEKWFNTDMLRCI